MINYILDNPETMTYIEYGVVVGGIAVVIVALLLTKTGE